MREVWGEGFTEVMVVSNNVRGEAYCFLEDVPLSFPPADRGLKVRMCPVKGVAEKDSDADLQDWCG